MYHIEATFGLLLYFYAILLLDISLVNKHVNIYWRILFQSEVRLTSAPIATVYIQSYDKNTTYHIIYTQQHKLRTAYSTNDCRGK